MITVTDLKGATMAGRHEMQSFYEMRTVLERMRDEADIMLRFMDATGLALGSPRAKRASTNGHAKQVDINTLKKHAAKMFESRQPKRSKKTVEATTPAEESLLEPDENYVTVMEAAKLLKMSDANIRLMMGDGRLPKPVYTRRGSKKRPGAKLKVMVIPKADVIAYRDAQKAAAN